MTAVLLPVGRETWCRSSVIVLYTSPKVITRRNRPQTTVLIEAVSASCSQLLSQTYLEKYLPLARYLPYYPYITGQ